MNSHRAHRVCQHCLQRLSRTQFSTQGQVRSRKKKWRSKDVRQTFLDFFYTKHDHKIVSSSSVLPGKGQGTYFTNAGMNQFKPIFLGTVEPGTDMASYRRVTNSQKCIRIGGKHNDLDDVGRDLTHHTFFEMLGSWSFGDYFKTEACTMALELLTSVYRLPVDCLYFTYFSGDEVLKLLPDLECRDIWRSLSIPDNRILPFGLKDNFWEMGDIGPCGPCTEIHYDHQGHRDASHLVNMDSPEVVEIWNLVFMQYNRQNKEKLTPLPNCHVDTGMGMERICAVLNNSMSNYDTDLFRPIFDVIQKETGAPLYQGRTGKSDTDGVDTAYRLISDHARMATVCISDGLLPGNFDIANRLRSVIYRGFKQSTKVLHGPPGLMSRLIDPIVDSLGDAFPEVARNAQKVKDVLCQTEDRYLHQIQDGKKSFKKFLRNNASLTCLSGQHVVELFTGYHGNPVPLDIIGELCDERSILVDWHEYEELWQKRTAMPFIDDDASNKNLMTPDVIEELSSLGISSTDHSYKYDYRKDNGQYEFSPLVSKVMSMVHDGKVVEEVAAGNVCGVILDRTNFYAEAGGQAADIGIIKTETGTLDVTDVQSYHGYVLHVGTVSVGSIVQGQTTNLHVNKEHRLGCMRNHSATHLLNSALRQVLGDVQQHGSSVTADKLVFEFTYTKTVGPEDIRKVEGLVKNSVQCGATLHREVVPLQEALTTDGVISLPDKTGYPSKVVIVRFVLPDNLTTEPVCQSAELCGGTHVLNTGDIGDFCIVNMSGVSQGVKIVTCLTGQQATQVQAAGIDLKDRYIELETLFHERKGMDIWEDRVKELNTILGEAVLPKTVRDEVEFNLNVLAEKIRSTHNMLAKERLRKIIQGEMTDSTVSIILKQTRYKTGSQVAKIMSGMDICKPVILTVASGRPAAVMFVPKGWLINGEKVCDLCQSAGCDFIVAKTPCPEKLDVFHLKKKGLQAFLDKLSLTMQEQIKL